VKIRPTDDAKHAHRLWSIRLAIASAAFSAGEALLPMWTEVLPQGSYAGIATLLGLGAAVARVIKQEALHAK
jgi:hypothetical protein